MNDILAFAVTIVAGFILGIFFFGGLYWTVRIGMKSKNPAFLFVVSFFIRTSSVLAGFYFLLEGHWEKLVTSMIGFLLARILIMQLSKPPSKEVTRAS